jgi:hypothetical protein
MLVLFDEHYAVFLIVLSCIVFIIGTYFLVEFHFRLHIYRIRRQIIIKKLSPDFEKFEDYVYEEGYNALRKDAEYTFTFIILLFAGAWLTNFLIDYFSNVLWETYIWLYVCLAITVLSSQTICWRGGCMKFNELKSTAETKYGIWPKKKENNK